jgi:hypothetical protein
MNSPGKDVAGLPPLPDVPGQPCGWAAPQISPPAGAQAHLGGVTMGPAMAKVCTVLNWKPMMTFSP